MILSERLELRKLTIVDAPFILELLNDGDFQRYIGDRGVRTLADAENYIQQGPAVSYARYGHGLYLVVRREDGARLGICGLIKRDTLPCEDIGYAFLPIIVSLILLALASIMTLVESFRQTVQPSGKVYS